MTKSSNNVIDFSNRQRETSDQVLERLFNEHGESLKTFIRRRHGDASEVEDVLQDVFTRLARMGDLQTKVYGDGRNYLFTIANNLIVDMERRKVLQRGFNTEQLHRSEGLTQELTPEKIVQAQNDLEIVKQVIMGLKPSWRRAFILNRFHYMTYRQVAEKMGITIKQAESHISQALARLRDAESTVQRKPVVRKNDGEKT